MKFFQKTASAALIASLVLAGCASAQPVTPENAPSDLLKKVAAISSESDGAEIEEVLHELVSQTGKANNYRLILDETVKDQTLEENEGKLAADPADYEVYDVRFAGDEHFYQVYEEQNETTSTWGVMDSTPNEVTTVYVTPVNEDEMGAQDAKVIIDSINGAPGEKPSGDQTVQTVVENSIIYPIYLQMGSTLLINPAQHPGDYSFELTKKGSTYEWIISMKDEESYNEILDKTYQDAYGASRIDVYEDSSFVLDSKDVKEVRIVITMDQDGTISRIENSTKTTAVYQDQSLDLSSVNTLNIKAAPEHWKSFFEQFFEQIQDEKLVPMDQVRLLPSKEDSSLSVEKAE